MNYKRLSGYSVIICFCFFLPLKLTYAASNITPSEIWAVRSVDTMKTSRDLAREKLNDQLYVTSISKELVLIKELGANYVTIDTPYDDEFYPYLLRWVTEARKTGLHIWFRGNFSGWEGWFGYPKNMTPQEHLRKTAEFIATHAQLFQDGDAFDPCPECENAGHWIQPEGNTAFNEFIMNQQVVLKVAFDAIHKNVHTNWTSIIGGRAKEVLNTQAITSLNNIVTIDHYVETPTDMAMYIDYFSGPMKSQVLIGEFGAPIPDINGPMDQIQQANFIDSVFSVLYTKHHHVLGINYFALSNGTTEIIDGKGNSTQAYTLIQKYYIPGKISGVVKNFLGDEIANEPVKTLDGRNMTYTNNKGEFSLDVPAEPTTIIVGGKKYIPAQYTLSIENGDKKNVTGKLSPITPSYLYKIRLWIVGILHNISI
jgi:hypothetical protein